MLRLIIQTCALFLAVSLFSSNAFAECSLSLQNLPSKYFFSVDAETINTLSLTKTISFTVENSGASECYYFVAIDGGGSRDLAYNRQASITYALPAIFQHANSDSFSYQLYSKAVTTSNIIKSLDDATFEQNVLGPRHIKAGEIVLESFVVHVPRQTLPNLIAESYDDNLMLTLYQNPNASIDFINDCPTCSIANQQSFNIQFGITEYVTLSIGSAYNPNTKQALLDFGELESNKQRSFEVYVGGRSGSGSTCSVTISSENGSKLILKDRRKSPQNFDKIDYTVYVQSEMGNPVIPNNIDLSAPNVPVLLATSSESFLCGNNNQGVMAVDVIITIGEVERKTSGIYRDTLTIEAKIGL